MPNSYESRIATLLQYQEVAMRYEPSNRQNFETIDLVYQNIARLSTLLFVSMLLFNATTTVIPSTRGHSRDTMVGEEIYHIQANFTFEAAMLQNVLVGYVTL